MSVDFSFCVWVEPDPTYAVETGGPWPSPHFYGTLFTRKDRDTLIEQSGSGYSNRAVTVFGEVV